MDITIDHDDYDSSIVKFVHQVMLKAIQSGASDIHFEPYEHHYRIRYRLDGLLAEITTPPLHLANRIGSRLKVLANLDIAERRIPQDGRFNLQLSANSHVDCRISTCPTIHGEKIVIRLLDSDITHLDMDKLGLNAQQKELFLTHLQKPQGLILVTGPTGSGKTVTLYTALKLLNTKEKNISTAEDPVEIKIPGINQVNVNPKSGLTFSTILRAFLRQDPDVIMVGEIRDVETAEIAIKAAQTGHLVLATLHTNNASETLTRLVNIGIPSFNIANSVSLLIAQRLARRLCEYCKAQDTLASDCIHCMEGYRGRVGLFEVLPFSKKMGQVMMSGANALTLHKIAQAEGMKTIYQSGLEKVKQGITTLAEINRVTVD